MDGSITTNKGIALIGKLLAQKGALQITRVAVGDGTPPASPATLNALVHELKNATIESVDNPKNGEAKIVVTVSSIGVTQGFFVKEIGVFAKNTDGKEILYAYAGFSDNPQWIRPEGTAITNVATYDINTIIDRVSDVKVAGGLQLGNRAHNVGHAYQRQKSAQKRKKHRQDGRHRRSEKDHPCPAENTKHGHNATNGEKG